MVIFHSQRVQRVLQVVNYNPTTLQPILSPGVVRDHFVGLFFPFFFLFNNVTLAVKEEAKFCLLGLLKTRT